MNHLKVGDKIYTEKEAVANLLAKTIEVNSSAANRSAVFNKNRHFFEKQSLNFSSDDSEPYNNNFSLS